MREEPLQASHSKGQRCDRIADGTPIEGAVVSAAAIIEGLEVQAPSNAHDLIAVLQKASPQLKS